MEIRRFLVMGVVKQGLGCDFDCLHELMIEHMTLHMTLRGFLGRADVSGKDRDTYQSPVDNRLKMGAWQTLTIQIDAQHAIRVPRGLS